MINKKKPLYLVSFLFVLLMVQTSLHAQEQYDTVKSVNDPEAKVVVDDSLESDEKVGDESYASKTPKGSFKNIYDSSITINAQRKVPDSVMKRVLNDDEFWYANKVEEEKKAEDKKESFLDSDMAKYLIWGILILFMLVAIIIYFKENQISLFSSRTKKLKQEEVDNGAMPENIFEIDYESAISRAIAADNYRLATRFLFLRTLKTLSSKKIIDYAADRTNFDYLFQINGTKYYSMFMQVARSYEYLWYGKFEVNEEQFGLIKKSFDEFQKQLA